MIGHRGDYKDYHTIRDSCPLFLQGPGLLEFYVRAHVPSQGPAPESVWVAVDGFEKFPVQRWRRAVSPSSSSNYRSGRAGRPTGGELIKLAIPKGIHELTVHGRSDRDAPVHAIFYYDGPKTWRPDRSRKPRRLEPVPIGTENDYKDYERIDQGFPLKVRGPGRLRFYVRAHVGSDDPREQEIWVVVDGIEGREPARLHTRESISPVSRYGDGRSGVPTGSGKLTVRVPKGVHSLTLWGHSESGGPVYAVYYYNGPPVSYQWDVDSEVELEMIYDDNILHYSEDYLDDFRHGRYPEKFVVETYDDLIMHPTLSVEVERPLLFGKRTRLRGRVKHWQYTRNDIKSNQTYDLRFRQYLRRRDYFELSAAYAPDSYIRELSDRPPFIGFSRPRTWENFRYARNYFDAAYWWRADDWLAIKGEIGRTMRFYNQEFMENDNWEWSGRIAAYTWIGRFAFSAQYTYSDVEARGYDTVGETLATSDDSDPSYEEDDYDLSISYRPRRAPLKTRSLDLDISFSRKFFVSQKRLEDDPYHVGRMDEQVRTQLSWTSRHVWRRVDLELGWQHTQRVTDSPWQGDIAEDKDYTGNRFWMSLTQPLD